jgi:Na+-translocating ferredoxin:NAD+ oxidoreductase RNF subunit RnfB
VNGLTGEGSCDIARLVKASLNIDGKKLTLRHSMPSAICGYCYGNMIVDAKEVRKRFLAARDIKASVPNINCQRCGFRTCNEFVRAVLDGKVLRKRCPFI